MYVSINLDLLKQLVGYAESRAEDLAEEADVAMSSAYLNEDRPALMDEAKKAQSVADRARRAVELGRRLVEGR